MYKTKLTELIIKSEQARKALGRVTPKYGDAEIMLMLFEAMGLELDVYTDIVLGLKKEMVPQTATWSIEWWEDEYGIPTNNNLTIEERRAQIIAKMQCPHPLNPAMFSDILSRYARHAEIRIVENVSKNKFRIAVYADEPLSKEEFNKVVYEARRRKPAHLALETQIRSESDMAYYYGIGEARSEGETHESSVPDMRWVYLSDYRDDKFLDAFGRFIIVRDRKSSYAVTRKEPVTARWGAVEFGVITHVHSMAEQRYEERDNDMTMHYGIGRQAVVVHEHESNKIGAITNEISKHYGIGHFTVIAKK